MRFKEGVSVEVLRKERDIPYGSWYAGKIIALYGDESIIRYTSLKDERGDLVEERVHKKDIRPQPQHDKKMRKRWVVGEMAEVFDARCWRVGKVAKVLGNEHLVIKIFGSIQLKEFHVSSLRIRRVWCGNKWLAFVREASNFRQNTSKQVWRLAHGNPQQEMCEEETSSDQEKDVHRNLKKDEPDDDFLHVPTRNGKRSHACDHIPALKKYLVLGRLQRKRPSKPDSEGCNNMPMTTNHSLSGQVGISNSKLVKETNNTTFSNGCSVASCSLNETADFNMRGSSQKLQVGSSYHSSDAESSFPALSCKENTLPFPGHKLEVGVNMIHTLELQAYKSTMQALYASGPLSWEQESLLTNLRLSLHISNDEHLLQLRHLLSAQVL